MLFGTFIKRYWADFYQKIYPYMLHLLKTLSIAVRIVYKQNLGHYFKQNYFQQNFL